MKDAGHFKICPIVEILGSPRGRGEWSGQRAALIEASRRETRSTLQGSAIASNVDVADYFRVIYHKTPSQWMAAARKMRALMAQPKNNQIYYPSKFNLTDEESTKLAAESAFSDFCRKSANSVR
jgi:hypothetical protein